MNSTKNTQEDDKIESDDDFQYEEVSLEDDWSVTEGEEDLEATVKAIQDRAQACAAAAAAAAAAAPGSDTPVTGRQEAVDDFLRSFLIHTGMTETLGCFQIEWAEMAQRGALDQELVGVVPEVYTENRRLESELQDAQREAQEFRRAASSAAGTLVKIQKARDFYRLQHQRVVQEKNRLTEDIRKLKAQCSVCELQVKGMNEKYQTVLKQAMQGALERDKALGQAAPQSDPSCGDPGDGGEDRAHSVIQPRPPSYANASRSQTRVQSRKAK